MEIPCEESAFFTITIAMVSRRVMNRATGKQAFPLCVWKGQSYLDEVLFCFFKSCEVKALQFFLFSESEITSDLLSTFYIWNTMSFCHVSFLRDGGNQRAMHLSRVKSWTNSSCLISTKSPIVAKCLVEWITLIRKSLLHCVTIMFYWLTDNAQSVFL